MLDILQQVSSGKFGIPLVTPMTPPTRCDTADHQFLVQEAIPHAVIPLEIGFFSS